MLALSLALPRERFSRKSGRSQQRARISTRSISCTRFSTSCLGSLALRRPVLLAERLDAIHDRLDRLDLRLDLVELRDAGVQVLVVDVEVLSVDEHGAQRLVASHVLRQAAHRALELAREAVALCPLEFRLLIRDPLQHGLRLVHGLGVQR
eukprot:8259893-Pyramimonas_sp.AAC.1